MFYICGIKRFLLSRSKPLLDSGEMHFPQTLLEMLHLLPDHATFSSDQDIDIVEQTVNKFISGVVQLLGGNAGCR